MKLQYGNGGMLDAGSSSTAGISGSKMTKETHHRGANIKKKTSRAIKRTARKKRYGGTYSTSGKPTVIDEEGSGGWGYTPPLGGWTQPPPLGPDVIIPEPVPVEQARPKPKPVTPMSINASSSGKPGLGKPTGKPGWSSSWVRPPPLSVPKPIECNEYGGSSNQWGGGYDPCKVKQIPTRE